MLALALLAISLSTPLAGATSPAAPKLALTVPTGAAPCGVTAHAGALWVGVYEGGELLRIGPGGHVDMRVPVGRWACRVAVGRYSAWVTRDQAAELVRVSLPSGAVDRVRVAPQPFDLLLAAGALWVTSWQDGTVAKIDPDRGTVLATIRVGPWATGLAWCGKRIWVGHGRTVSRLTSVDPQGLRVRQVDVGATPEWPHCIGGRLWVTTPDSILRLDPGTGRLLSRLHIGETLADAAAAPDGLVWVTDKEHSVVHRVSVNGRSVVDSVPAGPGAFAVARLGKAMWVSSFAGSDVRRFDS